MKALRCEGAKPADEALVMNGSAIRRLDRNLSVVKVYVVSNVTFCTSFVLLESKYLLLCDKYFVVLFESC